MLKLKNKEINMAKKRDPFKSELREELDTEGRPYSKLKKIKEKGEVIYDTLKAGVTGKVPQRAQERMDREEQLRLDKLLKLDHPARIQDTRHKWNPETGESSKTPFKKKLIK